MAEKSLQKLEDQLNCAICLDTYTNPKQLLCYHVYCQQCLAYLVIREQSGNLIVTCPNCRQVTPVPASGVAGLQSAFQINHLLEIVEEHKKAIGGSATASRHSSEHYCTAHTGQEVQLYCETCDELICFKCVIKGGRHHSHDYEELDEAFERYKAELLPSLEPMENQLNITRKALAELDALCTNISDQQESVKNDLHHRIDQLHQILDARKRELTQQLNQITQQKLKSLAVQRDHLETIQAQLSNCLEFVQDGLRWRSHADVLMMKANTTQQVQELTTTFEQESFKTTIEADLIFEALEDIAPLCREFGKVYTPYLPDPSRCQITSRAVAGAVVGGKYSILLQAINFKGEPCKDAIWLLESELVSEFNGARIAGCVERKGESQYEISYQPTVKGRHQLHVKISGQHIRGSPQSITVKERTDDLGVISEVKGPWGVAVTEKGEVVVTEQDVHTISIFSRRGEKLRSFGTRGSEPGQLQCPHGVAVDGVGNVLVADSNNHRVQKFTAEGKFLAAAGTKGSGALKFNYPVDVAFSTKENKVYVLDGNHCVQILNANLTFSSRFGKYGSNKGEFLRPCAVACDSTGKVYVADSGNHRIQVFTAKGKFVRMFGREGKGVEGGLKFPAGVAVNASGEVFVSESKGQRLSVFSPEGHFLSSRGQGVGGGGGGGVEFNMPHGVVVDRNGVLWVCDRYNYRVLTPFNITME